MQDYFICGGEGVGLDALIMIIKCYFLLAEAQKKQKMFSHTLLGAQ
jgi:hypothetical protein